MNGTWIGIHEDANELVTSIKGLRRQLIVPKDVSIVWDFINKEIRFYTDAGWVQRPLFIVENNKLVLQP